MDKPLVSICCLTYNHEKYLRHCLDGFMMQKTDFPFEVLIHDDASTDHTVDIIREYEAKYPDVIKPIYQTENQYSKGVRISHTYIYPQARGEFIALCEGDDFWNSPNKLQKEIDMFRARPELAMVYCDYNIRDEIAVRQIPSMVEKHSSSDIRDRAGRLTIEDVVCGRCRITTSGCVCRRKVFLEPVIPPESCRGLSLGDLFFKIDSAIYGGIGYIPEPLTTYRMVSGSATHTGNPTKAMKFEWDALWIREYYCNYCKLPEHVIRNIASEALNRMARLALLRYSPDDVRKIRGTAKKYGVKFAFSRKLMLMCGGNRLLSVMSRSGIAALKAIRDLMRHRKSMAA